MAINQPRSRQLSIGQLARLFPQPGDRALPSGRELAILSAALFSLGFFVLTWTAPSIDTDGVVLATTPLPDWVFPHYPPLYPLFVRSVNALSHNLAALVNPVLDAAPQSWSLRHPAPYTNASVFVILASQHALLAWSAGQFAVLVSRRWWLRAATAGLMGWSPPILLTAQQIMTEALFHPLAIAATAFAVRFLLYRARRVRSLALHFVFVGLVMLTRHPGGVFLALLPLAIAMTGLSLAWRKRRLAPLAASTRAVVVVTGLGLATLGSVLLLQRAVFIAYGIEPRSAVGRVGTYRINYSTQERLPGVLPSEMEPVIASLERRADDPQVRQAIRLIATSENVWVGAFNRVRVEVVEPAYPQYGFRQQLAQTDRILNQVAWLAITSTEPTMLRGVGRTMKQFLRFRLPKESRTTVVGWLTARENAAYLDRDAVREVKAARDEEKLRRHGLLVYLALRSQALLGRILGIAFLGLLILAAASGHSLSRPCTAVAAGLTAGIYTFLMAVVATCSFRFVTVVLILLGAAVALLLAALTGQPEEEPAV